MNILAVIPARGGSKRLPNKNIADFLGKPIISYTIEAALKTGLFKKVIVSSESEQILSIAAGYDVELHNRPIELATDTARVVDVCHYLIQSEIQLGNHYDILCCLYATSPLRTAVDICRTVELVSDGKADSAMAVTEYYYPPHQALKVNVQGLLKPVWPGMAELQSQKAPRMLIDNGSTYAVRVCEFIKSKSFRGKRILGHFMPRYRSVDIDTQEDLELATMYARKGQQ